jgi:hypothetical protein
MELGKPDEMPRSGSNGSLREGRMSRSGSIVSINRDSLPATVAPVVYPDGVKSEDQEKKSSRFSLNIFKRSSKGDLKSTPVEAQGGQIEVTGSKVAIQEKQQEKSKSRFSLRGSKSQVAAPTVESTMEKAVNTALPASEPQLAKQDDVKASKKSLKTDSGKTTKKQDDHAALINAMQTPLPQSALELSQYQSASKKHEVALAVEPKKVTFSERELSKTGVRPGEEGNPRSILRGSKQELAPNKAKSTPVLI